PDRAHVHRTLDTGPKTRPSRLILYLAKYLQIRLAFNFLLPDWCHKPNRQGALLSGSAPAHARALTLYLRCVSYRALQFAAIAQAETRPFGRVVPSDTGICFRRTLPNGRVSDPALVGYFSQPI